MIEITIFGTIKIDNLKRHQTEIKLTILLMLIEVTPAAVYGWMDACIVISATNSSKYKIVYHLMLLN